MDGDGPGKSQGEMFESGDELCGATMLWVIETVSYLL